MGTDPPPLYGTRREDTRGPHSPSSRRGHIIRGLKVYSFDSDFVQLMNGVQGVEIHSLDPNLGSTDRGVDGTGDTT